MTTLRELSYMIEANTDGLQKAFPALDKIVNSLERLDKSVQTLNANFSKEMNSAGQASMGAARTITRSQDQIKQSMIRSEAAIISATSKLNTLNQSIRDAGAPSRLLATNTRSFNALEKQLKNTNATAAEVTRSKARFNSTLAGTRRELQAYQAAQRQAQAATQQADAAMVKQENAVERVRIKYLDLQNALELQGAKNERIDELNRSFGDFEKRMQSGVLSAREFAEANNRMNAEMAKVRRNEGFTDVSRRMTDLAKSAQVALGPLSGVAARITAITSLANRNSVAIAGIIGGIIAFATAMGKAIARGAEYERQMMRIDGVLQATGNTIGMTANEVDDMARRVARATMTTQGQAREAAATILTLDGITGSMAEQALLAAQGLSLMGRGDIQSQIRRVARAIEDPANNLKALTESAIFFNAIEAERIKRLQESGRLDEARWAVMDRLAVAQAAATRETGGLSGAWDSLKESMTDFMQSAGHTGGAVDSLSGIVNSLTDRLDSVSSSTNLAVGIGTSFNLVIMGIGAVIDTTLNALEKFASIMIRISQIEWPGWLQEAEDFAGNILKAWWNLPGTLDYINMALDALGVNTGATEAASKVDELNDAFKQAEDSLKKLNEAGSDDVVVNTREATEHLERFRRAMRAAQKEIQDSIVQGREPDIDFSILDKALEEMNAGNIQEAANILEDFFKTGQKVEKTLNNQEVEARRAAEAYVDLKQQHMGLFTEQEQMQDQLDRLDKYWDLIIDQLVKGGKTVEQATAQLSRLRNEVTLNNNSMESFINNLERQTENQRRELAITRAVGGEKRRLSVEQEILNQLWSSGIITSSNYAEALEEVRAIGGPLAESLERIIAATKELDAVRFQTEVAGMNKDLEDRLQLMRAELALAGKSEQERAGGLEMIRHKQAMLNAGIEEGSAEWERQLSIIKQIAALDFHKNHIEAMKALQGQAKEQDRIYQSMFYSERTRDRMVALAQKEYELAQRYGSLLDERAQKELEVFKILQKRDEILDMWKDFADAADKAFKSMEDSLVEFLKTGEFNWKKFISGILEDIFRITFRQLITDPLKDMFGNLMSGITGQNPLPELGGAGVPIPLPVTIVGGMGQLGEGMPGMPGMPGSGEQGMGPWGAGGTVPFGQGQQGASGGMQTFGAPVQEVIREALEPVKDLGSAATDAAQSVMDMGNGITMTTDAFDRSMELTAKEAQRVGEASAEQASQAAYAATSTETMGSSSGTASQALEQLATSANSAASSLGGAGGGMPGGGGLANLEYINQGAIRSRKVTETLEEKLREAIGAVYGPGATGQIYSGGQAGIGSGLARIGSTRHDFGKAADLYIKDAMGNRMTGDKLAPLAQYWQAKGYGGTGLEMRGGGIHLDEHVDRARNWSYGGGYTPAQAQAIQAGQAGQMPQGMTGTSAYNMPQQIQGHQFNPMGQAQGMGQTGLTSGMPGMPGGGGQGLGGGGLPSFDELSQGVNESTGSFMKMNETLPELTENLTGGLDKAASSAEDLADNGLNRAASGMERLADDSIQQAVQAQVQSTTSTQQMGTTSTVTSTQVQQLGNAAMQAAAQMQMMGGGGMLGGMFHSGGIVGSNGAAVMMGGGFAGAPRLHGGLHPNEFRAILKRGEGVFTEEQMEALGDAINSRGEPEEDGGGGGRGRGRPSVTVNLHGVKDFDSFKKSEAQLKAATQSAAHQAMMKQG